MPFAFALSPGENQSTATIVFGDPLPGIYSRRSMNSGTFFIGGLSPLYYNPA